MLRSCCGSRHEYRVRRPHGIGDRRGARFWARDRGRFARAAPRVSPATSEPTGCEETVAAAGQLHGPYARCNGPRTRSRRSSVNSRRGTDRHPGQQCRRRARPGRPAARRGQRGRLAGDRRGQPHRRVPHAQAVAPGMKARSATGDRQHLERRRARHQPDRHPGLRQRQGRPDRPHAPARARARAVRHHRQQCRAGLRALKPDDRAAVGAMGE